MRRLGTFATDVTDLLLTGILSIGSPYDGDTLKVTLGGPSSGMTTITPMGSEFRIDSFFDVFIDVTLEGTGLRRVRHRPDPPGRRAGAVDLGADASRLPSALASQRCKGRGPVFHRPDRGERTDAGVRPTAHSARGRRRRGGGSTLGAADRPARAAAGARTASRRWRNRVAFHRTPYRNAMRQEPVRSKMRPDASAAETPCRKMVAENDQADHRAGLPRRHEIASGYRTGPSSPPAPPPPAFGRSPSPKNSRGGKVARRASHAKRRESGGGGATRPRGLDLALTWGGWRGPVKPRSSLKRLPSGARIERARRNVRARALDLGQRTGPRSGVSIARKRPDMKERILRRLLFPDAGGRGRWPRISRGRLTATSRRSPEPGEARSGRFRLPCGRHVEAMAGAAPPRCSRAKARSCFLLISSSSARRYGAWSTSSPVRAYLTARRRRDCPT